MHVHVICSDGEAKFWLEPDMELAKNYRLSQVQLREIRLLIEEHLIEIKEAWERHFES